MSAKGWRLRLVGASLVAPLVFLLLTLLALRMPWPRAATSAIADADDACMHLLVFIPLLYPLLAVASFFMGRALLVRGHASMVGFAAHAALLLGAIFLALILLMPGTNARPDRVPDLATAWSYALALSLPAAIAWRLVAGPGVPRKAA